MSRAADSVLSASDAQSTESSFRLRVILAFAGIYLLWGTTYLAIALALKTLPPFSFGAVRFLLAGGILFAWLRARERRPFEGLAFGQVLLCGILMLAMGNGLVAWSQQGIPSGIAALIVTSVPVVVLALDWAFFSKRPPAPRAALGTAIALLGVIVVITSVKKLSGNASPMHLAVIIAAVVAFSVGSLLQGRAGARTRVLNATCLQLLGAGLFLALMSGITGEWRLINPGNISASSVLAVVYLAVFSGIVAMTCYLWLLKHVSAQKASTYALVNPIVALSLGGIVLGERLTPKVMLSALLVLVGVGLVLFSKKPAKV